MWYSKVVPERTDPTTKTGAVLRGDREAQEARDAAVTGLVSRSCVSTGTIAHKRRIWDPERDAEVGTPLSAESTQRRSMSSAIRPTLFSRLIGGIRFAAPAGSPATSCSN